MEIRSIPLECCMNHVFTSHANQFRIQIVEDMYYLNFFEAIPPQFTGSPEEIAEQLEKITSIKAEGVARIAVTKAKLREILEAIQGALGDQSS